MSADGRHGLTVIAFIGSVFSPYYAAARRRGPADPENYCAFNVALYGSGSARWSMTERGANSISREKSFLAIGPSCMRWTGAALEISVVELCAPLPKRIRGTIRLVPTALFDQAYALEEGGRHSWTPYAPCAHVEVDLERPELRWSGVGYFDANSGGECLETDFESWTWSRAGMPASTVVLYDTLPRRGAPGSLALQFKPNGDVHHIAAPPIVNLPPTGWKLSRYSRADLGHGASVVRTLEDAPFYSRSLLDTQLLGARAPAVHESLSLNRFRSRWVQCLLPFRMPRKAF